MIDVTYLFVAGLDLGLASVWQKLGLEHMVKLLGQCGQLSVVRVFDKCGTHNNLKELALQDNLTRTVDVFRLNFVLMTFGLCVLVLSSEIVSALAIFKDIGEVLSIVALWFVKAVHHVELGSLVGAEQGEMVLLALVVDAIKHSEGGVGARDVAVAEEAPSLAQGHTERLLALGGFDLARVEAVPALHLTVVAKHDVLDLLFNVLRICLVLGQIANFEDSLVRVRLNFLASGHAGSRLGTVWVSLALFGGNGRCGSFVDDPVYHAVLLEGTLIGRAIFKGKDTVTLFEVLSPVTFILASVRVVECSLAMAEPIRPVTDVAVAEQFECSAVVEPDVSAEA